MAISSYNTFLFAVSHRLYQSQNCKKIYVAKEKQTDITWGTQTHIYISYSQPLIRQHTVVYQNTWLINSQNVSLKDKLFPLVPEKPCYCKTEHELL